MEMTSVESGTYIVAVSGGVDSMVLLDLLMRQTDLRLIVAHFDHGIREDSHKDRQLVQLAAAHYELPFYYHEAHLGAEASEEQARNARYAFLERTKTEQNARGIITAHHQDDVIETMCINLIRGTGRRGLTSLRSRSHIVRPLLTVQKQAILAYAHAHHLQWYEDQTNQSDTYLRNRIRHYLMLRLTPAQRQKFIEIYDRMTSVNDSIDEGIKDLLANISNVEGIERSQFVQLSYAVSVECMLAHLRDLGAHDISRKHLHQLVVAAKTAPSGKMFDIDYNLVMKITRKKLIFDKRIARKSL